MTDDPLAMPRRQFVSGIALAGAALAAAALPAPLDAAPGDWDNSWIKHLKAKHRTIFDAQNAGSDIVGYPGRYLDAMLDGYGAKPDEVQVIIGLSGKAWPAALNDLQWNAYSTAGRFGNSRSPDPAAMAAMQKRGAILLVCNNSLRSASHDLAATKDGGDPEKIYADLRSGILPGITVVPAMAAAIALAQESHCVYVAA